MKVLVTGATGLLGANVVEDLLAHGHEVHVLVRKTSNALGLEGLSPTYFLGDLQDQASLIAAAINCQAIVHCAANTKQWNTSKKEHDLINLQGTQNILSAAGMAGPEKVIFVSTANTFPLKDQQELTLHSDYIESKKAAEDYVLAQRELPAVVINPSFMIGARDVKPSSGQAILHYLKNNPVFTPAGGKSFIHVKDVATAIRKCLEKDVKGERFLMANDNRSYHSFFKLIGEVTGEKRSLVIIPPFLSSFAGSLGTFYGTLTGSSPKLTNENAAIINSNLFYDGEPSYEKLEIEKRSLEEAIEDAVRWFKENRYY
jgi:dihydroflavonol-4-reductase